MMEVRHTRGLAAIGDLISAWRNLARESDSDPLICPDWFYCLVTAYGLSERLHLLSVWADGRLTGVLPLLWQPRRWPSQPLAGLSGATTGISLRFELLAAPGEEGETAIAALWQELARWQGWQVLELHPVPAGGGAERLQAAAAEAGYRVHSELEFVSHYIDLTGGAAAALAATKRDFRAELRRTRRRLQERGPLWLETLTQPQPQDVEAFFALEAAGWKGHAAGGNAVLVKPAAQRRFYHQLAAAAESRFLLHRLRLDQRVIASSFGLLGTNSYAALKWSYDEEFAAFGPGHLLIESLLEDCEQRGLRRFELGGEDFAYKRRWTSTTIPHSFRFIIRPNWRGRLLHRWKRRSKE